jgi:hypothetical protein
MRFVIISLLAAASLLLGMVYSEFGRRTIPQATTFEEAVNLHRVVEWTSTDKARSGGVVTTLYSISYRREPVYDASGLLSGVHLSSTANFYQPSDLYSFQFGYYDGTYNLVDSASESNGRIGPNVSGVTIDGFVPLTAKGVYTEWTRDAAPSTLLLIETAGDTGPLK